MVSSPMVKNILCIIRHHPFPFTESIKIYMSVNDIIIGIHLVLHFLAVGMKFQESLGALSLK